MATAKKTARGADAPKATYIVTSPLEHDLERYEVGAEIDLTEDQAEPLLGHTVKPKQAS